MLVTRLLQKSQRVEQSSSFRSKKTAIGWISKQLLGHTAFVLPKEKCEFCPLVLVFRLTHRCVPRIRMFQTDLGSLDLS